MGRTRFDGPVYGAKGTLLSGYLGEVSSGGGNGSTVTIMAAPVPVGETWFVTDWSVVRVSTGSSAYQFQIQKNSSVISSGRITDTTAQAFLSVIPTADGGESEGIAVAGPSTLALLHLNSSAVGASSGLSFCIRGFTRFVDSSRIAF
jgi:hypothetical protein